jgi:hypothetical protein
MLQTRYICVDKSFANKRSHRVATLAARSRIIVPSAFYFEVLTTSPANRVRELAHFDQFNRVHLSKLRQQENRTGNFSPIKCDHVLSVNPKVLSLDWEMSAEEQQIIDRYRNDTVQPAIEFWMQILQSYRDTRDDENKQDWVPGIDREAIIAMERSDEQFVKLCSTLRFPEVIRRIALAMGSKHGQVINERWLEYRRIQTWVLQALVLLKKHPPRTELPNPVNLEHDVQDLEYLMLGLHCGALASCETNPSPVQAKMVWRYKLLQPDGYCITD